MTETAETIFTGILFVVLTVLFTVSLSIFWWSEGTAWDVMAAAIGCNIGLALLGLDLDPEVT